MVKSKQDKKRAEEHAKPADGGWRETVESIAMAVILALLFRGFVAEAFVIPTGSMAPTLQGRHKDVECPKCGVWYRTTASMEVQSDGGDEELLTSGNEPSGKHVTSTTCPICRYTQKLDLFNQPNDGSFSGDRIIVAKFAYDFAEPQRWDVIVFKFPGNAVQNYIKRLIGLPGETVRIVGGNIWVGPSLDELEIARKPPHKLDVLLQMVDDTDHIPQELVDIGWPARWQAWPGGETAWKTIDGGRAFEIAATPQEQWLRYRHLVPSHADWKLIELARELPEGVHERPGQLIPDFYAYNAAHFIYQSRIRSATLLPGSYDPDEYDPARPGPGEPPPLETLGQHWVDDLAVEVTADVQSSEGEISLLLTRAGVKHLCRINVADGVATMSMIDRDGQPVEFEGADGKSSAQVTARTSVRGPGRYRLRLSNCDHEMLLWVDGSTVEFDGPTTYVSEELVDPFYSAEDPGDMAPAGVAARGAAVRLTGLKIYRDKYYIATNAGGQDNDYIHGVRYHGMTETTEAAAIQAILQNPALWDISNMFDEDNRRAIYYELQEDQFLPLGDNSPQSYDGRFWTFRTYQGDFVDHHFVERDLLIGKALLIYWPHTWNRPIPFTPNFSRMGPIR